MRSELCYNGIKYTYDRIIWGVFMNWEVNKLIHDEFASIIRKSENNKKDTAIMALCGIPGSGKTKAALEYCKRNPSSVYFSFHGYTEAMARRIFSTHYPKVFSSPCETWQEFFDALYLYAKRRTPVFFFDDTGERNDKGEFFEGLQKLGDRFLEKGLAMIVLTRQPWESFPVKTFTEAMPPITPPEISRLLPRWSTEDVFRLYSLTEGLYALVAEAEGCGSFGEYLENVCNDPGSAFMTLVPSWLNKLFRAPEAYHVLLFGIVQHYNYITGLSEFTGYPKNKCEKYLGALIEAGLAARVKPEGRRSWYEVALNYIMVWYGCVYAAMNRTDGVPERIAEYMESRLVPMMLHREIMKWLKEKSRRKLSVYSFKANRKYEFRTVHGICFDYYRRTKEETVFAIARMRFDDADWEDIERAVCSVTRFSDAKIALCSIHQFSKFYWKLNKKYDNIRLVQLKSMG